MKINYDYCIEELKSNFEVYEVSGYYEAFHKDTLNSVVHTNLKELSLCARYFVLGLVSNKKSKSAYYDSIKDSCPLVEVSSSICSLDIDKVHQNIKEFQDAARIKATMQETGAYWRNLINEKIKEHEGALKALKELL